MTPDRQDGALAGIPELTEGQTGGRGMPEGPPRGVAPDHQPHSGLPHSECDTAAQSQSQSELSAGETCAETPSLVVLARQQADAARMNALSAAHSGPASHPPRSARFIPIDRLGFGGQGEVWLMLDPQIDRRVAMKIIQPAQKSSQSTLTSFRREAEISGRLEHPNIVPVYDVTAGFTGPAGGSDSSSPCYIMRLFGDPRLHVAIEAFHKRPRPAGEQGLLAALRAFDKQQSPERRRQLEDGLRSISFDLTQPCDQALKSAVESILREDSEAGTLTRAIHKLHSTWSDAALRKLLNRFQRICEGVAYAHSRGVIHRDLKPDNVMLGEYGETLVADWGLAKVVGRNDDHQSGDIEGTLQVSEDLVDPFQTRLGDLKGTPAWMSPEQAMGRVDELGPATDIYSLGAILYCLVSGRSAVQGQTLTDVLSRVRDGDFRKPCDVNPQVDRALEAIVLKAMSQKPGDRYAKAIDLAADVERWLNDEPVTAYAEPLSDRARRWVKKHRTAVTTAAATLLLGTVGLFAWGLLSAAYARDLETANTTLRDTNLKLEQASIRERNATLLADRRATENASLAAREQAARRTADTSAAAALRQTKLATQHLYAAHMNLAQNNWDNARVAAVVELLGRYRSDGLSAEPLRGFEWHYWNRLIHDCEMRLDGHFSTVAAVAFSPDGTRLASAGWDGEVKLWDAATGRDLGRLGTHADGATCVAFSGDGKWIASAGRDCLIRIFDVSSRSETAVLKEHADTVWSVAWSPDGRYLASASRDQTACIWNVSAQFSRRTVALHSREVFCATFSPDSRELATAGRDRAIRLWNVSTGKERRTLAGHKGWVRTVAWSPDGSLIASAGWDQVIRLWDVSTGTEVRSLKGHFGWIRMLAFSPDGRHLASGSGDQTVRLWDPVTGDEKAILRGHTGVVWGLSFHSAGTTLASCSGDLSIRTWGVKTDPDAGVVARYEDSVAAVDFHPAESGLRRVACAGDGHILEIRDVDTRERQATLSGHTGAVTGLAWSRDGKHIVSSSVDQTVKVWRTEPAQELVTLRGHTEPVSDVAVNRAGDRVASAGKDRTVRLWDLTTGTELSVLNGHQDVVSSVAFSPDGRKLISTSHDGTARIWDTASGRELLTFNGHSSWVFDAAFSPDGKIVASAGRDRSVRLWEAATGRVLHTCRGHVSWIYSVQFSPDGRRIVSAAGDKSLKLWDVSSGHETLTLNGHTALVRNVAWSADGKCLVSVGDDRTVRLWDTLRPGRHPQGQDVFEALNAVAFHRDRSLTHAQMLDSIRADPSLSALVRAKAVEFAQSGPSRRFFEGGATSDPSALSE